MDTEFHVIIPARYHSTRFPKKLLMDLHGQTVLERVYCQSLLAKPKSVTIATDHVEIFNLAQRINAPVIMTDAAHTTGTDRIAEVVKNLSFSPQDIIINVQGDEPLIPPALITQVADVLARSTTSMATLCWPIDDYSIASSPHVVKVVRDNNRNALYFSRNIIPAHRDTPEQIKQAFRHIGIYAYRASFLLDIVTWPVCELETIEAIEPLRVLWAGHRICVEQACVPPMQDINTPEDLERARIFFANKEARQETT